jgi:hypothetical protein
MAPALLAGLLGVAQGVRHALEPDHVTAVATVMVGERSPRRGVAYAASWGLGHGSIVVLLGGLLVALRAKMPDSIGSAFEIGVGVMLVALGVRALRDASKPARAGEHEHAHAESSRAAQLFSGARRPFAIGVVHGLAGSGALAAVFAVGAPSTAAALAGLILYAMGTTIGMSLLAGAAGPILARAGRRPNVASAVIRCAGAFSIVVGLAWTVRSIVELA